MIAVYRPRRRGSTALPRFRGQTIPSPLHPQRPGIDDERPPGVVVAASTTASAELQRERRPGAHPATDHADRQRERGGDGVGAEGELDGIAVVADAGDRPTSADVRADAIEIANAGVRA
jgi:hypothetical protein